MPPKATVKMKEKPTLASFGDTVDRFRPSRNVSFDTKLDEFQPRNTNINDDYFKVLNKGEPENLVEFAKAFLVNTYGEILFSFMFMVALWQPNYVSLLFVGCSFFMFQRLPSILQEDLEKRLMCYLFLCEVMLGILAMCFANKLTLINFGDTQKD